MWINPFFDVSQRETALDIVRSNPLAVLIAGGDEVRVSHMPLLLEELPDGRLELVGHMPRVDPMAAAITAGETITCVFRGPQSYVSPAWYADPGLPTYNYLVAQLTGTSRTMQSEGELREHLIDLIAAHEASCPVTGARWQPDAVADARIDELLRFLIGFRITVDVRLAKAKLGQNRSLADQAKAAGVLHTSPRSDDHVIAELMERSLKQREAGQESGL